MLENLAHCGEKLYFFSYLESIQPMKYIYIYIYIYITTERKEKGRKERIKENPYKLGIIIVLKGSRRKVLLELETQDTPKAWALVK